jgi:thiosulfate/3-mercaptopyruvate sulfurtransferase
MDALSSENLMISGPIVSAETAVRLLGAAVILDARAGADARADYLSGHVKGAVHADLENDLSQVGDPRSGGRHPLPPLHRWLERLGEWGIAPSTPVLIYDAAGGGMAAARAWWMLDAIGHQPLAVVDGGWAALQDARAPKETGPPIRKNASPAYRTNIERWPSVDIDFVDRTRLDDSWRVIDARAPERYAGQSEPIDPIAGHIPGAHNLYWQTQVDEAGKLLDRASLRARYAEVLRDAPPERVVCYCGSGVTACHLLLAMSACGLRGAQLYVGSWSEWCRIREGAI